MRGDEVQNDKLAIVLSGGGARGAYEAGVIHYIRTALSLPAKNRRFDIYTGSSVGAINACFMASTAHQLDYQGQGIHLFWSKLQQDDVYRRDTKALMNFIKHSTKSMLSNLSFGVKNSRFHYRGFLDNTPLMETLTDKINFKRLHDNIQKHHSGALAVIATNVMTGKAELFIDKNQSVHFTGAKRAHLNPITASHALASSAIPIIFRPVLIEQIPYIDGGLRLNTPLSPALQLGADRILTIGLHHSTEPEQPPLSCSVDGCYPTLGQVLGRVMNTIFLDHSKADFDQMTRINRIIDWVEQVYGESALENINQYIKEQGIRGDIAERGLKKIETLNISPSKDIGELFLECYQQGRGPDDDFSIMQRFLTRALDINPESGADFLSYLAFMPRFIHALLDLGYQDANSKAAELEYFLRS